MPIVSDRPSKVKWKKKQTKKRLLCKSETFDIQLCILIDADGYPSLSSGSAPGFFLLKAGFSEWQTTDERHVLLGSSAQRHI